MKIIQCPYCKDNETIIVTDPGILEWFLSGWEEVYECLLCTHRWPKKQTHESLLRWWIND